MANDKPEVQQADPWEEAAKTYNQATAPATQGATTPKVAPAPQSTPTTKSASSDPWEEAAKTYKSSATTGNPAYNDPTKDEHPYWHAVENLVTHPLKSVDQAHEYYANQSK